MVKKHAIRLVSLVLFIALIAGFSSAQTDPLAAPKQYWDVHRLPEAMTIDGVLEDGWLAHATKITLEPRSLMPAFDPDDLTVHAYVGWQPDALYIAFDVTDDALVLHNRVEDLRKGDSVEFWIGHHWFVAGQLASGDFAMRVFNMVDYSRLDKSTIEAAVQQREGGYVVELKIPAPVVEAMLGAQIQDGLRFPIAFTASEKDDPEEFFRADVRAPIQYGWNDPETYAEAKLTGAK